MRSHSASTSLRTCEDKSTLCPRSRASWMLLPERLLHQRVEAAGRLIEDQQLGARHQGGDERELLAIALGVRADLHRRIEGEALHELVAVADVHATLDLAEQVQRLGAGERRPEIVSPGTYARRRCTSTVWRWQSIPKTSARPLVGTSSPSSRRTRVVLPAPFGPRKPTHLALGDGDVEPVEREGVAEPLGQPRRPDRWRRQDPAPDIVLHVRPTRSLGTISSPGP